MKDGRKELHMRRMLSITEEQIFAEHSKNEGYQTTLTASNQGMSPPHYVAGEFQ
jgi:hypothetical protein